MFYGDQSKQRILSAREQLEVSPFMFYLTGSRFFGTEREDSDWDYFVQQSPEVETWLKYHGLVLDSESYSGDLFSTKVYKKENVHVQVVVSAKLKQQIQKRILESGLHLIPGTGKWSHPRGEPKRKWIGTPIPKEQMAKLWAITFRLYRDGMEAEFNNVSIPSIEKEKERLCKLKEAQKLMNTVS